MADCFKGFYWKTAYLNNTWAETPAQEVPEMKKYKAFSRLFFALAIILSDIMCAQVAFNYCNLQWETLRSGFSAPAEIAFLLAIPYAAGILICAALAWLFHKKWKNSN